MLRLVECRDHLVTKQELLEYVWADTAVSEAVLTYCVAEVRHVLGDERYEARFIRTASGHGYKFIAPVEILDGKAQAFHLGPERTAQEAVRVVVLPLENLSGNPGQEYFAAGLTDELTTQLACVSPERCACSRARPPCTARPTANGLA